MATAVLEGLIPAVALPAIAMPPLDESEKRYEVIDGELKEKPPMGAKANRVATILARKLDLFADEHKLGPVFTMDCAYQIFPHKPSQTRKPDVSFVPADRVPAGGLPDGNLLVVPGLAVEVVSTNDLAENLEERVHDFLQAGVKLLWLIYPTTRSVYVVRQDGTGARLTEVQELSGEDVVPDFTCPLRTLFADV